MSTVNTAEPVQKLATGIPGFDHMCDGGVPRGRTTLVAGTAGSAKTVLACQFLVEGIRQQDHAGVFVTLEETPEDIRRNMHSFGWDISDWEEAGKLAFVDGSPRVGVESVIAGSYDLGGLLVRIEHAVRRVNAQRVSLDSLGAIFNQFSDSSIVRRELLRIASALRRMGVTSVLTAERTEEYGPIARYGVEEFVSDNVVILRNVLEKETRRRTVEILKFRGTPHHKGEYPFTITADRGIVMIPLSAMELKQRSSDVRVPSGNSKLDEMCGGGYFRDSIVLLSGATGTGKTLTVTEFAGAAVKSGERCLLCAFEESREQLFRNASGWGVDLESAERSGMLRVMCRYPETASLEDHLLNIKADVEEFKPSRVAVDSLSALERVATDKGFREFVIGLSSFIKHKEIVGLCTSTTPTLTGGTSVTEGHISTLTDTIVLLRYVEMFGEMQRGIAVLKMRGSLHDKQIREFTIDQNGMHIGRPFRNVVGILAGSPHHVPISELERLEDLFSSEGERAA